eukprot:scaffold1452_cov117-Isochrysis_galbana.AAC.20
MAPTGLIEPTSLLACITVTSTVSGRRAVATASADTRPSDPTGTYVASHRPSAWRAARQRSTAGCSALVVTTCGGGWSGNCRPAARAAASASLTAPTMAWLSASEPHEVKRISFGCAPINAATAARAAQIAAAHGRPNA